MRRLTVDFCMPNPCAARVKLWHSTTRVKISASSSPMIVPHKQQSFRSLTTTGTKGTLLDLLTLLPELRAPTMPAQLQRRLFVFLLLLSLIAAAFFGHWWLIGRHLESTDNAYVQGEITRVSSQLGARIDKVLVQDNQHVEHGELLLVLESADFELAKQRAEATLATREAELSQARSTLNQQDSLIAASRAEVSASEAPLAAVRLSCW